MIAQGTIKLLYIKPLVVLLLMALAIALPAPTLAAAWKLNKAMWSEGDEKIYETFVEAICDSKYSNLNSFIKDPKANPLFGKDDLSFNLLPDCADLPYVVRAYVAYKLRLPFSYASAIRGNGGDIRYSRGNRPVQFKSQQDFKSPQDLFYKVLWINSGNFRMAASLNDSDHYPIKINPKTLVPGTIYYDPNGHVALVGKVTADGRIRLIDAHPDKSISKPWFGTKFVKGTKDNGGGFKKWRPIRVLSDGRMIGTQNHNLPDYSDSEQFQSRYAVRGKSNLSYHSYIREALNQSFKQDPLKEFAFMMQEIYEDLVYRSVAVDLAVKKGLNRKAHPGALPWNIYGTDGIWEEFSTPSRDARLKVAFKEFYDNTRQIISDIAMINYEQARTTAYRMLEVYNDLSRQYVIYYKNSNGKDIALNFNDVLTRLFYLSFDPYHSPELRWGATGTELASAQDSEVKLRFYQLEQRLRNNLERVYGQGTPLSYGPEHPIEVNIKRWLEGFIRGERVDTQIIAITPEHIRQEPVNTAPIVAIAPMPSLAEANLVSIKEEKPSKVLEAAKAGVEAANPQEALVAAVKEQSNAEYLPKKEREVKSVAAKPQEEINCWIMALGRVAKAISNPDNYSAE
jgi:hypothetical protein